MSNKPKFVLDTNIIISALTGDATAIISGDEDLLILQPFRGISIYTVQQFLLL